MRSDIGRGNLKSGKREKGEKTRERKNEGERKKKKKKGRNKREEGIWFGYICGLWREGAAICKIY